MAGLFIYVMGQSAMSELTSFYEMLGLSRFVQASINMLVAATLVILLAAVGARVLRRVFRDLAYITTTAVPRFIWSMAAVFEWHKDNEVALFRTAAIVVSGFLILITIIFFVRTLLASVLFGPNLIDTLIGLALAVAWVVLIKWYFARETWTLARTERHNTNSGDDRLTGLSDGKHDDHANKVMLGFERTIQSWIDLYSTQSKSAVLAGRVFAFAASIAPFFTWLYFTRLIMSSDLGTLQKLASEKLSNLGMLTFLGASTGFVFLAIAIVLFKYARTLNDKITTNEKRLYYLRKLRVALIAFPSQPDLQKGLYESLLKTGDAFEMEGGEEKVDGAYDGSSAVLQAAAHIVKGSGKL